MTNMMPNVCPWCQSPLDTDLSEDDLTAMIERLHHEKQEAVANRDFNLAKSLARILRAETKEPS